MGRHNYRLRFTRFYENKRQRKSTGQANMDNSETLAYKIQDKDEQNKLRDKHNTRQKIKKMSNTNSTNKQGMNKGACELIDNNKNIYISLDHHNRVS